MADPDVDKLPPTQYLIGEVLTARYRLGEPFWHFPLGLGRAILSVTSCPKCGHAGVGTRHVRASDPCSFGCRCGRARPGCPEGFVRSCRGCGYAWFTSEVLSS